MIKINYSANLDNTVKADKLFKAVNYEAGLMKIDILEDNIKKQEAVITNKTGSKTKEDIAVAKIRKSKYLNEKELVVKEIKKIKPDYEEVIKIISGAEAVYADEAKEEKTAKNSINAVRNVLRLTACGENPQFFANAIITKINNSAYETLYKAFESIYCYDDESAFDENGKRLKDNTESFKTIRAEVQSIIKNMFSIPVKNDFTKKINVKFSRTDLAKLNDTYCRSLKVSMVKDSNTGELVYKSTNVTKSIVKKVDKNGNVAFEAKNFNKLLAQLAFQYICK